MYKAASRALQRAADEQNGTNMYCSCSCKKPKTNTDNESPITEKQTDLKKILKTDTDLKKRTPTGL